MCEHEEHKTKTSVQFPLRRAPEIPGKFPFRDMKYYLDPVPGEELEAGQAKVALKKPRFGYVAQRSIQFLEASGRKPDLENVMWPPRKSR